LLIETLGQLDYSAARAAARRVFRERATHAFPPVFIVPPIWRPELAGLAAELGFPVTDAADIERIFRDTIRRIETAQWAEAWRQGSMLLYDADVRSGRHAGLRTFRRDCAAHRKLPDWPTKCTAAETCRLLRKI